MAEQHCRRSVGIGLAAALGLILSLSSFAQPVVSSQDRYRSAWVDQSPYLTLTPGASAQVWVRLRNAGTAAWYRDGVTPMRLGTARPEDRPSVFYTATDWLSPNRVALGEEVVRPSDVATFAFTFAAPSQPGLYREYFRPVVDGVIWMNDEGIYWDLVVRGQPGAQPRLPAPPTVPGPPGAPPSPGTPPGPMPGPGTPPGPPGSWPSPGTPPGLGALPEARGAWIFQTGTDADGQPIPYADGMMMRTSCADCHGVDGRGLRTPMFTSPDITYRNLTDPAGMREPDGERGPTYTDMLIRRAVQQGLGAEEHLLDWPMPRWQLTDRQWEDLLAHLKTLP